MTILSAVIFGAKTIFKPMAAACWPWLQALGSRYWLYIGAGLALFILPMIINNSGRKAVVADVNLQASKILLKDAEENARLAVEGQKIQAQLEAAATQFEAMKKKVKDDVFKSDAIEWASQPVPASVRLYLAE